MEKEKKSKNKPMVFVFAGPNGSGKSTITEYFDIKNYTNADDIVKSMGVTNEEAAVIVQKKRYESKRFFHRNTVWISLSYWNRTDSANNLIFSN